MELNIVTQDFLGRFVAHGVAGLEQVGNDIRDRPGFGTGDPASWVDWLDGLWRLRQLQFIEKQGPDNFVLQGTDGTLVTAHTGNTVETEYEVRTPLWDPDPRVGNFTFTDVSGFMIMTAFVNWSGWEGGWLISDALSALTDLRAGRANREIVSRWGSFLS